MPVHWIFTPPPQDAHPGPGAAGAAHAHATQRAPPPRLLLPRCRSSPLRSQANPRTHHARRCRTNAGMTRRDARTPHVGKGRAAQEGCPAKAHTPCMRSLTGQGDRRAAPLSSRRGARGCRAQAAQRRVPSQPAGTGPHQLGSSRAHAATRPQNTPQQQRQKPSEPRALENTRSRAAARHKHSAPLADSHARASAAPPARNAAPTRMNHAHARALHYTRCTLPKQMPDGRY